MTNISNQQNNAVNKGVKNQQYNCNMYNILNIVIINSKFFLRNGNDKDKLYFTKEEMKNLYSIYLDIIYENKAKKLDKNLKKKINRIYTITYSIYNMEKGNKDSLFYSCKFILNNNDLNSKKI